MADRTALTAIGSSGARQCQQHRRGERQQSNVPAAPDRLAPTRRGIRSAAQQRSRPDAEIAFGGEVSFLNLPLASHHSITSSAVNRSVGGIVRPSVLAVARLITSSYLVGCWKGRSPAFSPRRTRSTYDAAPRYCSTRSVP